MTILYTFFFALGAFFFTPDSYNDFNNYDSNAQTNQSSYDPSQQDIRPPVDWNDKIE